VAAAPAAAAGAAPESTGGSSAPVPPVVEQVVCADATAWKCAPGERVTLEGVALDEVRVVRFLGRAGRRDDRLARPARRAATSLQVRVPTTATSGPVAVVGRGGHRDRTARWLRLERPAPAPPTGGVLPVALPAAPGAMVYPIAGAYRYGTETNHFGGGRNHKGEDVFAACGTPLVAITDAVVQHVATHARAGHYVVLQRGKGGESFAYMHLRSPSRLRKGDTVKTGEPVGAVGDTGHATGCHLHFEHWTAPGWYAGGEAVDPLPLLRSLEQR